MRDNDLATIKPVTGYSDSFLKQSAGIFPHVQDKTFDVSFAERLEIVLNLFAGGLGELLDTHECNAGLDPEGFIDTVAGNLGANQIKGEGLSTALAGDYHLYLSVLGAAQQVGDLGAVKRVAALVVHFDQNVTGTNAGAVGGRATERMNDHGLAGAGLRPDGHAYSVVLAMLLFAEAGEILRIEEVRVRIKGTQHARDSAFVDALVCGQLVGVVLIDYVVNLSEGAEACLNIVIRGDRSPLRGGGDGSCARTELFPKKRASCQKKGN